MTTAALSEHSNITGWVVCTRGMQVESMLTNTAHKGGGGGGGGWRGVLQVLTLQCQQASDSILVVGLISLITAVQETAAQENAATLTSSVSTLTMIFMSVFSSRPDRVFFMGLNLLTKMSMSPVSRACACCSVRPHVAKGGRTKTADAICRQQQAQLSIQHSD